MTKTCCNKVYLRRARGFTLLEVLVAFLVLSIGLIGLAGLQLSGVQNTRDAYYGTQAVVLAEDMADRMRANLKGVTDDKYDNGTASSTSSCVASGGCTTTQMAGHDIFLWNALLARELPSGQGIACVDSTPNDGTGSGSPSCDGAGSVYAVKVWWDDDRNSGTAARRYVISVAP